MNSSQWSQCRLKVLPQLSHHKMPHRKLDVQLNKTGRMARRSAQVPGLEDDGGLEQPADKMYSWEGTFDMSWANVRMDNEGRLFSDEADQVRRVPCRHRAGEVTPS